MRRGYSEGGRVEKLKMLMIVLMETKVEKRR